MSCSQTAKNKIVKASAPGSGGAKLALDMDPEAITLCAHREGTISSQISSSISAAADDRYQQALVSTKVKDEMNNRMVRIPGFIVPLEFDDDQTITQFFLVPYFGACLHMPPPPPNQIILVDYENGLRLEALYQPFWISGKLSTSITENAMATSAYSLQMQEWELYTE